MLHLSYLNNFCEAKGTNKCSVEISLYKCRKLAHLFPLKRHVPENNHRVLSPWDQLLFQSRIAQRSHFVAENKKNTTSDKLNILMLLSFSYYPSIYSGLSSSHFLMGSQITILKCFLTSILATCLKYLNLQDLISDYNMWTVQTKKFLIVKLPLLSIVI